MDPDDLKELKELLVALNKRPATAPAPQKAPRWMNILTVIVGLVGAGFGGASYLFVTSTAHAESVHELDTKIGEGHTQDMIQSLWNQQFLGTQKRLERELEKKAAARHNHRR